MAQFLDIPMYILESGGASAPWKEKRKSRKLLANDEIDFEERILPLYSFLSENLSI